MDASIVVCATDGIVETIAVLAEVALPVLQAVSVEAIVMVAAAALRVAIPRAVRLQVATAVAAAPAVTIAVAARQAMEQTARVPRSVASGWASVRRAASEEVAVPLVRRHVPQA